MFRRLALLASASASVGVVAAAVPGPAPAAQRPNVVVVMTDDQDFRSMWAMPKTRRLLGAGGTTFQRNFVSFPLCCPSRATFLTGQYAHNHGVLWNNWPQGGFYRFRGGQALPVWLRRAGYRTAHIGKCLNEYGERDPRQVPPGWDDWHGGVDPSTYGFYDFTLNHNGRLKTYGRGREDYSTDVYARLAQRVIRRSSAARKPFFLSIAPNAPHTVAVATRARREGTPAVPAPRHAARFAAARLPRHPNFNEADISDKPALARFFPNPMTPAEIASLTDHYRGRMGSLLAVDDLVARVAAALERAGVARNTVVVYTSDNGWILGEHRLRDPFSEPGRPAGVKFVPFDGSARVPLLIAGPGFPAGRRVPGVTANTDLAATILDVTGARPTVRQDGRSLLRAARRPGLLADRAVLLEAFPNPQGVPAYASVRTARYRYDVTVDGDEGLYDFKRDPWALRSRQDDPRYAPVKAVLARRLARLRTCRGRSCRMRIGGLPEPAGRR